VYGLVDAFFVSIRQITARAMFTVNMVKLKQLSTSERIEP
jgi:hypothetical protein